MKKFLFLIFLPVFHLFAQKDASWIPDLGNGTYKNPIIYADYSDPDIILVGDHFFMTASFFNCVPGLHIFHSNDLINWKLVNHAIKNFDDPVFDVPQHPGNNGSGLCIYTG